MKRSEVWWINFDPFVGSEIKKKRPAVVISNNISNSFLSRCQVVPLSTNVDNIYPSEALVSLNGIHCKAMVDQLTTVSKQRFLDKEGKLSASDMQRVENAIKQHLDL
jgi:mRNA interferase MazF